MIGERSRRKDARAKMDGSLRYTADVPYEGLLYGAIVRAPMAHGRITAVKRGEGVDWDQIVFATADDIPGDRQVQMIQRDMPFLAEDEVLYHGEPVALVAAETPELAEAARRDVTVEMQSLPSILTLDELVHRHRKKDADLVAMSSWTMGHGDPKAAISDADIVLERCYTTPHQEQAYLETNAMTAIPEEGGSMRVEGSLQCPYYVAPAVAGMLGVGLDKLHVLALPMGGAFGGKEDYPSQLGGHVALLAKLSDKPVRIVLSRDEDMATTTKRHPAWVRIRAGATADGRVLGVEIDIVFDGGAYATMSPVVLSRGAIHAAGPYRWPAVAIDSVAYRSHTPPNGAFRGFGVPQTAFAIETLMDELAEACHISPEAFRELNRLRPGDITATSQRLEKSVASKEVLETAMALTEFSKKRDRFGKRSLHHTEGRSADAAFGEWRRGIGLSFFWHGAGFTGSGEAKIAAKVAVDLAQDGKAHIRVSSTEMGQGSHTVLPQIVAESLGVEMDDVVVDPVDTRYVPNSGPTVASRTTMIVGGELQHCAQAAKKRFLEDLAHQRGLALEDMRLEAGVVYHGRERLGAFSKLLSKLIAQKDERWAFHSRHQLASTIHWDEAKHHGDAYATYGWGTCVVELSVNRRTFEVDVHQITMVVDVGRAVNPAAAQGQIEGGTLQALGYALCEEVGVKDDGTFLRDRFQTYIIPTSADAPPISVKLLEIPYERGPGGAKGLGEMPMNGAGPAVANAINHALGIRLRDLPLTPEKIFDAMQRANTSENTVRQPPSNAATNANTATGEPCS